MGFGAITDAVRDAAKLAKGVAERRERVPQIEFNAPPVQERLDLVQQVPPTVVDRTAYWEARKEAERRAQQALAIAARLEQERQRLTAIRARERERAGLQEVAETADPATATYARQLLQAQPSEGAEQGNLLRRAYNAARTDIPFADQVIRATVEGFGEGLSNIARPLDILGSVAAPRAPGQRPSISETVRTEGPAQEQARVAGELAGQAVATFIPEEAWELALELSPFGTIADLRRAFREGAPEAIRAVRQAVNDPRVQRITSELASETGALRIGRGPSANQRLQQLAPTPATITPDLSANFAPPPIRKLPQGLTPEAATAFTEAEASGGVVRGLGNALARRIDDLLTRTEDAPSTAGTRFIRWFSQEADRFERPVREAIVQWNRNRTASAAWAAEQGNRMGRRLDAVFGKPNDVFVSPRTGAPITVDGRKLLNRDVVENYNRYRGLLTNDQVLAAETNGEFIKQLRSEALRDGVRLGSARGIQGGPVDSYVHRTTISKDGTYFAEYGDPGKPGIKISAENARDYVTAAEGVANGVRYSDSWTEEYVSHLQALRFRQSDLALKEWLDAMSATKTQRLAQKMPTVAAAPKVAAAQRKVANAQLRQAVSAARRHAVKVARKNVGNARRAVSIAQRRLDDVTRAADVEAAAAISEQRIDRLTQAMGRARERLASAIKAVDESVGDDRALRAAQKEVARAQRALDEITKATEIERLATSNAPSAQKLAEQVSRAREQLASAVQQLRQASEESVDALRGRLPELDVQRIEAARANVERATQAQRLARQRYRDAMAALDAQAPFEVMAPGGQNMPVTAGRIFDVEDARYIQEAAQSKTGDNVLLQIARFLASPLRIVALTVDHSFALNQGWQLAANAPLRWARTVLEAPLAAASPQYRARWLNRHRDAVENVMRYAPEAFDSNPDFFERGSFVTGLTRLMESTPFGLAKAPTLPFRISDKLFRDARTMAAVHSWEFFVRPGMTEEQKYDLGSAIVKIVGTARTAGPEKDALLAARYFRSQIGFALDAVTNGGVQGDIARKTFMKMLGGAATLTLAYYMARGERDPKKLIDKVTPGKPGAFSIEGWSLLGPWGAIVNTLANPKRTPNYLRGKLNFLWGGLISGLTGEDVLGEPTSLRDQFLGLGSWMPLSFRQYQENIGEGAPLYMALPAAILGGRYRPPTAYAQIVEELEKSGFTPEQFFAEPGTRREIMAANPRLKSLYTRWEEQRRRGTREQRQAQKIVDESRARIEAKIAEIRAGGAGPDALREFATAEANERRLLRDALLGEAKDTRDRRLDPLYETFEQATNPQTGELDFDKALQLQEAYLAEHPELREVWEKQQYTPFTEDSMEVLLKTGQRIVGEEYEVGGYTYSYYGVGDQIWQGLQESYEGLSEYETAEEFARVIAADALARGLDPDDELRRNTIWAEFSEYQSNARRALVAAHPEVAAHLRVWYGVNIADSELPDEVKQRIAEETARLYEALGIRVGP